jgi:hypothetical protein
VIGTTWKDKAVIRSRSKKMSKAKANTPARIAQRARFSLGAKFLNSMKDVFALTFPEFTSKMTARNSALGQIIRQAVQCEYPNLKLEYKVISVSKGSTGKVIDPTVASTAGKINFTWDDSTGLGTASKEDDKAVLVAYCPELDVCVFTTESGKRVDKAGELNVRFFTGKEVHTWIAFINATMKNASESIYLGALTVA